MRRQLIAFLALLTGLAALGAPANASISEALNHGFDVSAQAEPSAHCDRVTPADDPKKKATKCRKSKKRKTGQVPEALRLPVLMGVERAYE